ncbi:MAG: glycosyltransferase family 39 protein [Bradyrhizobium sp.]|nr:glycosyltransferase family 39 protein [Bradyrhizobium sp.]MBV9561550.1 glycosyltransferase family 39 protein [Bradyrhizobium sp.]
MAARAEGTPARWRKPFQVWLDGIEAGWAIPLMLIGFVAIWWAFLAIAYTGGDLHQDVLETWTLGRSFDWGNSKHPPLMGWVARAWTSVFPLTNWSFQLMAIVNAAIALWMVDLVSRRFVSGDKRVIVLSLLMLLPIYQFHAQRFNANTVLLATWPLATWCFLRSFETRALRWAAAAGASAALAMLGKYYSVFLLASFAVAAICHPERRTYFLSWAPWVTAGTTLVALAPHIHWLAVTGAQPFTYALAYHAGKSLAASLHEVLIFVLGIGALVAVPAAICALMAPRWDFRAMPSSLRLLLCISIGTVAFPAITSVVVGTDMLPLWALQGVFLFVILIVAGTKGPILRFHTVNLAAAALGIGLFAVFVAAPAHALYRNQHPLSEGRNFYRQAAAELTRQWHAWSETSLPAAGGDDGLAFALAFYSPDHPSYDVRLVHPHTLQLPDGAGFAKGWAALCYVEDADCVNSIESVARRAEQFVKSDFVVQSALWGETGASQRFTAFVVPPASDTMPPPVPGRGIAQDFSARRRQY